MLPFYSLQASGKPLPAHFFLRLVFAFSATALFMFLLLSHFHTTYQISLTHPTHEADQRPRFTIPDTLHYVYIHPDPNSGNATLQLHFSNLLSIYAAHHYLRPSQIYLHTNAIVSPRTSSEPSPSPSSKWESLILTLPELSVSVVPCKVPAHTKTGKPIKGLEHQSDFVRVEAVHRYGGTYLNWDVHLLRSIDPLLQSGFKAIAGRQKHGQINSGVFMSVPRGRMITLWKEMMHTAYDGGWTTHSNAVLTRVGERLVGREPGEMLVMEREAFAPGSWEDADTDWLFGVQNLTKASSSKGVVDLEGTMRKKGRLPSYDEEAERFAERWEHPERFEKWEQDWSRTYLLHAFSPDRWGHEVRGFNKITPRYVLERRSNFARAVYPVARLMYERGLIGVEDLDTW